MIRNDCLTIINLHPLLKQINSQTYGNSPESVQFQKHNYQWILKTTDQFTNIIKDLRKSCFRVNYQLYWKETNISPLSILLSQESFNCNNAYQTTRWHQKSNESQQNTFNSPLRLLESIWLLTFLFWLKRCSHSTFPNVFYIGFLVI